MTSSLRKRASNGQTMTDRGHVLTYRSGRWICGDCDYKARITVVSEARDDHRRKLRGER
jgi:hypothetical protein